jgi:hypothetical protein
VSEELPDGDRPVKLKRENGLLPIFVCAGLALGNIGLWFLVGSMVAAAIGGVLGVATLFRIVDYIREPVWYFEIPPDAFDELPDEPD